MVGNEIFDQSAYPELAPFFALVAAKKIPQLKQVINSSWRQNQGDVGSSKMLSELLAVIDKGQFELLAAPPMFALLSEAIDALPAEVDLK